ncbi:MAG: hypothetical protein ACFFDI_27725, partial [Promethearchaeota archaeon]
MTSIEEELKQISLFMDEGRYQKALQAVKEMEIRTGLTDTDNILLLLRKSEILELMGEHDQAFNIAHHSYQE